MQNSIIISKLVKVDNFDRLFRFEVLYILMQIVVAHYSRIYGTKCAIQIDHQIFLQFKLNWQIQFLKHWLVSIELFKIVRKTENIFAFIPSTLMNTGCSIWKITKVKGCSSGTMHICPVMVKPKCGRFFQSSQIFSYFSAICLQFTNNLSLRNTFWLHQQRVKYAPFLSCILLHM